MIESNMQCVVAHAVGCSIQAVPHCYCLYIRSGAVYIATLQPTHNSDLYLLNNYNSVVTTRAMIDLQMCPWGR